MVVLQEMNNAKQLVVQKPKWKLKNSDMTLEEMRNYA